MSLLDFVEHRLECIRTQERVPQKRVRQCPVVRCSAPWHHKTSKQFTPRIEDSFAGVSEMLGELSDMGVTEVRITILRRDYD